MRIYSYNGKCNIAGKKIKELRKLKGLSQEQLSAKMQVQGILLNQKAISRMETGKRLIADYELMIFAKTLDISVDKLLSIK